MMIDLNTDMIIGNTDDLTMKVDIKQITSVHSVRAKLGALRYINTYLLSDSCSDNLDVEAGD